jgi:hypothetical protein
MGDAAASARRRRRALSRRDHRFGPRRLNDEERAAIEVAAARAGMRPIAFAAAAALAVAREEIAPIPVDERELLRALMDARVQVRRIGNNLNQVARAFNMGEDPPELAAVLRLVGRAVEELNEATAALTRARWGRG